MKHQFKKSVLFITAFPPSENAAAEKNTMLLLQDLSANGYNVDLVYFKDADKKEYKPVREKIRILKVVSNSTLFRVQNALRHPFIHPIFSVRYNNSILRELQNAVDNNDYSAIIFDHSQTLLYARMLHFDGPKILICHDVEAQRFERTSNKWMALFCKQTERKVLLSENANVFAFCQKDVDLIKDYYNIDAHVVLDYIDDRIINYKPQKTNDNFVMFGNWVRQDNYEGAVWLLNGLGDYLNRPITVNIIGKRFPIERVKTNDKINIVTLGFVDNPYPLIAESKAMLCPLFSGAGIKVKVIESLASGTPVIGTEIAFEGFSDSYSKFMLRSQDLNSFAREMEMIGFCMEERMAFKDMFLTDYTSLTIPNWLNNNI